MMAARSGRTELVDILLTGENINIDYQIVSHSAIERETFMTHIVYNWASGSEPT